MKTTILVNRELTELETFTIDRFSYYFNNNDSFALIGDGVIVAGDSGKKKTQNDIINDAKRAMNKMTSTHPDFESILMDDGNACVRMDYNIIGVVEGKTVGLSLESESIPLEIALMIRENCIKAASNKNVIAVVMCE